MKSVVFLPKNLELSEEIFGELGDFLRITFSAAEKENIRTGNGEKSTWNGTEIYPNSERSSMFFPANQTLEEFSEAGKGIVWKR